MTNTAEFHLHSSLKQEPSHSHEHSHAAMEHGHSHEHLEHAGLFEERDQPAFGTRNWQERAFTVGIGGYALHDLHWS